MRNKPIHLIILFGAFFSLSSAAVNLSASEPKTFEITAQKFSYEPERIEINEGDQVILNITAVGTKHGVGIKVYNIDEILPKDETITIEFIADKKGEFTIQCTKFCGWGHFGMQAVLVVR
jgi:cytochrome c oxidase subunit 2